jgi:hypothetical protein
MRFKYIYLIMLCMPLASRAQSIIPSFASSVSESDRHTLMRSSIPLTDWHAKSFWPQYYDYREKILNISLQTYESLEDLGMTDQTTTADDASARGSQMLSNRLNELEVRRQYYTEIAHDHNGVVAMKFIQAEFTIDLVESLRVYELTPMHNYRIRSGGLSPNQFIQVKYATLSRLLDLTPEEASLFFSIYTQYEEECRNILGDGYDIYGMFAGEASDLTPGLAKRHGANLLVVLERELELKEKYFNALKTHLGSQIAARFLAWEDYYSTSCKLEVWAAEQR